MKNSIRLTSGLLVLGMLAAAPLAFAQSTTAQEEAAAQQTQPTSPPATGAAEQQPRQAGASGQGLSWADLDADGNGNLSLQEATRHQGLSSVFTQADTDGDGELTADEYRGYIQKQQAGDAAQE